MNPDAAANQLDYLVNAIRRVEAELHAYQRSASLRLERAQSPSRRARQRGEVMAYSESRRRIRNALSNFALFQVRSGTPMQDRIEVNSW